MRKTARQTSRKSSLSIGASLICVQLTGCAELAQVAAQHPAGAIAVGAIALVGGVAVASHEAAVSRRRSQNNENLINQEGRLAAAQNQEDELLIQISRIHDKTCQLCSAIQTLQEERRQQQLTAEQYALQANRLSSERDGLLREISQLKEGNAETIAKLKIQQMADDSNIISSSDAETVLDQLSASLTQTVLP